jgi:hypothetical protein
MLNQDQDDDLWWLDEPPIDEPSELFSIPEIRQHLVHDRRDDEIGLRSLVEHPDALAKAWRRPSKPGTRRPKRVKRHVGALHAA